MSTRRQHQRLDKLEEMRSDSQPDHTFASELSDRALAKIGWPEGPPNGDSWDELAPDVLNAQINRALNQKN